MVGISRNKVTKLLADLGNACSEYQHRTLRNLICRRLQLDEIKKQNIKGYLDPEQISISVAWRANLTMRVSMRRFTRLTNAFSKK